MNRYFLKDIYLQEVVHMVSGFGTNYSLIGKKEHNMVEKMARVIPGPASPCSGWPPHTCASWMLNPIGSMVLREFMPDDLEDIYLICFSWNQTQQLPLSDHPWWRTHWESWPQNLGKGQNSGRARLREMGTGQFQGPQPYPGRELGFLPVYSARLCKYDYIPTIPSSHHPPTGSSHVFSSYSFWWLIFFTGLPLYRSLHHLPSTKASHSSDFCHLLSWGKDQVAVHHLFFTPVLCGQGLAPHWHHSFGQLPPKVNSCDCRWGEEESAEVAQDKHIAVQGCPFKGAVSSTAMALTGILTNIAQPRISH